MIEQILPATVASAEAFADPPDIVLFPEEEELVARAVDKRRKEFATARGCARSALATLGFAPAPIMIGEKGAPRWPEGVVGSITHCAGYRAAAVAPAGKVITIGVDAEPDDVLPDGVLDAVSLPGERVRLRHLAATAPGPCWDRLLFCAKEAVYKAWFPLARRWLGFEDADITINAADGTFAARLLVPGPTVAGSPLTGFDGRWLARDGLLLTAIARLRARLAAPGAGRPPEKINPGSSFPPNGSSRLSLCPAPSPRTRQHPASRCGSSSRRPHPHPHADSKPRFLPLLTPSR